MTIERNSAGSPTVIIRGNSASGKSSTAHEVRRRYGRGCSLIEQDYLRRVVLREHGSDATPTVAPAFIMTVAQAALAHGYHLVLEGILHTHQYGEPLRQLIAGHRGPSFVFWLQVSLGETVRRHQQRVEPIGVTPERWPPGTPRSICSACPANRSSAKTPTWNRPCRRSCTPVAWPRRRR